MLIPLLVFIFFVLLAIAHELHVITDRLIETGTLIEHFNRRDLRASGAKPMDGDDDFGSESITQTHRTWRQTVWAIVIASLVSIVVIKFLSEMMSELLGSMASR